MVWVGVGLIVTGFAENLLGVDVLLRPRADGAVTHPGTMIFLIMLAAGLLQYRPHKPTPLHRYIMSGTMLLTLSTLLATRLALWNGLDIGPFARPVTAMDGMGSDTALIVALLFASAIARRHFGRVGLGLALLATSFLLGAFIALSLGKNLFEGQMSPQTLAALVPMTMAVLTLYAHRPFARVLLLSGPVGYRTRMTVLAGTIVPWLCGLVLHRVVGVPDRIIPVEAMMIAVIIFCMCAVAIFSGLYHERADRERHVLSKELHRLAVEDQLTGVLNRNGIKLALEARWAQFQTDQTPYHVILFDLDHFKQVNDGFGHDVGDRVLETVGRMMASQLRSTDVIGRWGGEEFLIVSETSGAEDIAPFVRRLCAVVADRTAPIVNRGRDGGLALPPITASFGVAGFDAADPNESYAIKRADLALYQSKENGRNRVTIYDARPDKAA